MSLLLNLPPVNVKAAWLLCSSPFHPWSRTGHQLAAAFYQSPSILNDSIKGSNSRRISALSTETVTGTIHGLCDVSVVKSALSGRQRKFCSLQCKNRYGNNRFQSYISQQERGRKRKIELVSLKGKKCQLCGYNGNYSALEFHHIDPDNKKFQLDLRSLSNRKWSAILCEATKCLLICSNCHKEVHNPECALP